MCARGSETFGRADLRRRVGLPWDLKTSTRMPLERYSASLNGSFSRKHRKPSKTRTTPVLQCFAFLPVHQPVTCVVQNPLFSIFSVSTNKTHVHLTLLKRVKDHGAEMRACVVRLSWRAEGEWFCRRRTKEHLHHGV